MKDTENVFNVFKKFYFKGDIRCIIGLIWVAMLRSGSLWIFWMESHFSVHILVAYLENFSKHYNITIFFIKYISSYKTWKLQYRRITQDVPYRGCPNGFTSLLCSEKNWRLIQPVKTRSVDSVSEEKIGGWSSQ